MRRRRAAVFAIPAMGHIHATLPVARELVRAGVDVEFFGHVKAERAVTATGARFHDLYAGGRDMDDPDAQSQPLPLRNIGFAAKWGASVAAEVAHLGVDLVVNDAFAVVGRVVAAELGLPRVAVLSTHDPQPGRDVAALAAELGTYVAQACHEAVAELRRDYGFTDASPFSFLSDHGADLYLYCEPPDFSAGPTAFQPSAHFGSLLPELMPADDGSDPFGPDTGGRMRVYVGLGSTFWMIDPLAASQLLQVLVDGLGELPDVSALVTLGGSPAADEAARALQRPNVRVVPWVDQHQALRRASVFVTHAGANSVHEAIYHGTPMICRPLFGDQIAMAARLTSLGLAQPLGAPDRAVTVADVRVAFGALAEVQPLMLERLAEARVRENEVVATRAAVVERMLRLG